EADRPYGRRSTARHHVLRHARVAWPRRPWRGVPRRHRRRSAVRRHGALREAAHPPRLVRHRPAGPADQLLRTGRTAADGPIGSATTLLPARTGMGTPASRGARDGGGNHRVAGTHLGSLLADAAGDPAWLLSTAGHRSHVAPGD